MNKNTFFFVLLLNLVCILNCNAQETSDDLYEKVTSVEEYERYHLIAECDGKFYCAQNVFETKSASLGADEITIDKNGQFNYGPLGKNGFEFTRKGNGYKIFSYSDRKYYHIKNKKIAIASSVSELDNAWILSIQANGSAKISYGEASNASKTYTLVFDKEIKKFVATSNLDDDKYTLPYIYGKPTHFVGNITVSNTHWTTFYSDFDVKLPSGIDVYSIKNVDEEGTLTCKKELSVVVAYLKKHSPVLIYSEQAGAYPCYETNKYLPTDLSSNNYLRGTSTDQMIEAEDDYAYYMLTYGTIDDKKVFGFFYGAEDGGPFVNKGGKAYLAVPKSIANQSMGFALVTDNKDVTNIGHISSNPDLKSSVVTTLSGIQLKCDKKDKLPKGIYIINGKKIIVK